MTEASSSEESNDVSLVHVERLLHEPFGQSSSLTRSSEFKPLKTYEEIDAHVQTAMTNGGLSVEIDATASAIGLEVHAATQGEALTLGAAVQLLALTVPPLTGDALGWVNRIQFATDSDLAGSSWKDRPGVVLLGGANRSDPIRCAESLFHEPIHSKGVALERGCSPDWIDDRDCSEHIYVPWRSDGVNNAAWPSSKTFDAYYVYSHLSVVLAAMARLAPSAGSRARTVAFRAAYLGHRLRDAPWREIGDRRREIVAWLDSCRMPAFQLSKVGRDLIANGVGPEQVTA